MWLVVGLGNPGNQYEKTRHNAGFWVVDAVAERFNMNRWQSKWKAQVGDCRIGSEKVILCKPQTFMNLSGESLSELCSFYSDVDVLTQLIVVYDDMDFSVGQVKLRASGSAGGHNGIKSIVQHLGTSQFPRIRFGIGRPSVETTVIQHVLASPPKEELSLLRDAVSRAADAVEYAVQHGFAAAMNRFNA